MSLNIDKEVRQISAALNSILKKAAEAGEADCYVFIESGETVAVIRGEGAKRGPLPHMVIGRREVLVTGYLRVAGKCDVGAW